MGIFQKATYDLCCDGCGSCHSESTGETYPHEDWLRLEAEKSGWENIDGKWYCPHCYHVDRTGNYVPNKKED